MMIKLKTFEQAKNVEKEWVSYKVNPNDNNCYGINRNDIPWGDWVKVDGHSCDHYNINGHLVHRFMIEKIK